MADIQYEFADVKNGYADQAIWNAVYFALTPEEIHGKPEEMLASVQLQWRAVTVKLKEQKFNQFTGANFQFARNCPPTGAITRQRAWSCSRVRICPFCWGRDVVYKTWNRLTSVVLPYPNARVTNAKFDIITFANAEVFEDLTTALREAKLKRNRETSLVTSHGSFTSTVFVPHEEGIRVRRLGLLVVDRGVELPELSDTYSKVVGMCPVSHLPRVVGGATRFPAELFRAEADQIVEILKQTSSFRMCSYSGGMFRETQKGSKR